MELITRAEARERGLKRFFTGVPCRYGHVVERYTGSKQCVTCSSKLSLDRYYTIKSSPESLSEFRSRTKSYEAMNREMIQKRRNSRKRARRQQDPMFFLHERVSRAIRRVASRLGLVKSDRTVRVLGCSMSFFAAHIEAQFLPGMSWENRHLWHIDHIVAASTAETEADVIALSHFTNLRPLWGPENVAKSDKALFLL